MADLKPLTGLRGLSSLMIVCHHACYFSKLQQVKFFSKLWLFPGWFLNIFFLLSGYSLAVAYGRNTGEAFNIRSFYQNRFARIAPLYYFCSAITFPFLFVGYGLNPHGEWGVFSVWTALIDNLLGTTSWCVWWCSWAGPFCGPTWFISTLLFFYLLFPFLLPHVKHLSSLQISRFLIILFYLQLSVINIVSFINLNLPVPLPGLRSIGEWVTIRHPISRLPVFLMGVLAGVQQLKINEGGVDGRSKKNFIHDLLPWDFTLSEDTASEVYNCDQDTTAKIWARKVNVNSAILLLGFIVWYNKKLTGMLFSDFITVQCLLTIILGMTRDKGFSIFTKICSSRLLQFLGRISAPLFLLHHWMMKLICWYSYGQKSTYNISCRIPAWGVPVVILVSPILAWIVHIWLEEPARKWLRSKPGVVQIEKRERRSGWWIMAPFLYLVAIISMRLFVWYTQPQWLKY